jgi:hypothetical protein
MMAWDTPKITTASASIATTTGISTFHLNDNRLNYYHSLFVHACSTALVHLNL